LLEKKTDEMAQRTEPAQHGGDQRPRQCAIAFLKAGKARLRVAFEFIVERAAAPQHAVKDVGGKPPRGEPRRVGGAPSTGRLITPALHCENSSLQQAQGYAKSRAMPIDPTPSTPPASDAAEDGASKKRRLSEAAQRALAEAATRRAAADQKAAAAPKEIQGRDGPEPTRYGDWEINGLTSDF
jgi:hypothetical protein